MVLLCLYTKLQLIGIGYQIKLKICQNILYSHCFMTHNTFAGKAHQFQRLNDYSVIKSH